MNPSKSQNQFLSEMVFQREKKGSTKTDDLSPPENQMDGILDHLSHCGLKSFLELTDLLRQRPSSFDIINPISLAIAANQPTTHPLSTSSPCYKTDCIDLFSACLLNIDEMCETRGNSRRLERQMRKREAWSVKLFHSGPARAPVASRFFSITISSHSSSCAGCWCRPTCTTPRI